MKKMKSKRGQNTAEYIILLVLVAVGTIGVTSFFGQQVKLKMNQVAAAISGDNSAVDKAKTAQTTANTNNIEKINKSGNSMAGSAGADLEFKASN